MRTFFASVSFAALVAALPSTASAAAKGDVIISEIAWMGGQTTATNTDEWIELYNTTSGPVDVNGWKLSAGTSGGAFNITMSTTADAAGNVCPSTVIPAGGFMLLTGNSNAAVDAATCNSASCVRCTVAKANSSISNSGVLVTLVDNTAANIDSANQAGAWFAGSNTTNAKRTMERSGPACGVSVGTSAGSWHNNDGVTVNGKDSGGNAWGGTPGAPNSGWSGFQLCSTAASQALAAADGADGVTFSAKFGGVADSVALATRVPGGSFADTAMVFDGSAWSARVTTSTVGPLEWYIHGTQGSTTLPATPPTTPGLVGFYDPAGPSCIKPARSVDANGAITNSGVAVLVGGAATTVNPAWGTTANQFFLQDACSTVAAMSIFGSGTAIDAKLGDSIAVLGRLTQFNGLTELTPVAAHAYGPGTVPAAAKVALADLLPVAEDREGQLLTIDGLSLPPADPNKADWPANNTADASIVVSDSANNNIILFIHKETSLVGTARPTTPIHLTGILVQFAKTSPFVGGWELVPRGAADLDAAPAFNAITPPQGTIETAYTFSVSATDREGETLSYSADGLPAGATLDAATGVLSWTPAANQAGSYGVTFKVSDGIQTTSATATIVIVNPANRPPVLRAIAGASGTEGVAFTPFTVQADDPDGDTVTYSMTGAPDGASVDKKSGVFNWTPNFKQAGTYSVTFVATDPSGLTDSKVAKLTVADANGPPTWAAIVDQKATVGVAFTMTAKAEDPDNDPLTYAIKGTLAGAAIDASTGVFTWTPADADVGEHTVTLTASDNQSHSTDVSFKIKVAVPPPPGADMAMGPDAGMGNGEPDAGAGGGAGGMTGGEGGAGGSGGHAANGPKPIMGNEGGCDVAGRGTGSPPALTLLLLALAVHIGRRRARR